MYFFKKINFKFLPVTAKLTQAYLQAFCTKAYSLAILKAFKNITGLDII